jgi:serine/threonine protein kinase
MSFSTVGAASTDPTVNGTTAPLGDPDGPDAALAGLGQARRIGRYTLLELLGHGGMGVVFAAYDEELDRKVAIKFMHHAGGDPRARAALLGEAQALARLAHPNVIHVYEVGETGDQVFLAMEFVRGQTLRQWLRQPRPWPEVVAMFLQAGRGLAAAHQAGLVHCDFKPENALVGQDGRLRVLDFGLARRQGPDAATTPPPTPTPPRRHRLHRRHQRLQRHHRRAPPGRHTPAGRHPGLHPAGAVRAAPGRRPLGPVQLLRRAVRGAARAAPLRRRHAGGVDAAGARRRGARRPG